jgi:hypothetical protein
MFPRPAQNHEAALDATAWGEQYWMRFFAARRMTVAYAFALRGRSFGPCRGNLKSGDKPPHSKVFCTAARIPAEG